MSSSQRPPGSREEDAWLSERVDEVPALRRLVAGQDLADQAIGDVGRHDGFASSQCGPQHRVIDAHGTIDPRYGSPELSTLSGQCGIAIWAPRQTI